MLAAAALAAAARGNAEPADLLCAVGGVHQVPDHPGRPGALFLRNKATTALGGASVDRSNANHHRADKALVAEAEEFRVHYRATMPAETAGRLIMDLPGSCGPRRTLHPEGESPMTQGREHETFEERCPVCGDVVQPDRVNGERVAVTCPNCGHSHAEYLGGMRVTEPAFWFTAGYVLGVLAALTALWLFRRLDRSQSTAFIESNRGHRLSAKI